MIENHDEEDVMLMIKAYQQSIKKAVEAKTLTKKRLIVEKRAMKASKDELLNMIAVIDRN